jgi:ABC-2 type transport system ATP-binding protein
MMISIVNLTKKIKDKVVLDEVTYEFKEGNIYGLYGRNGSGKTMLLRAIAGLIFSTKGKILVDEKEMHKDISFPPNMGLIIENTNLLPQYDAFTNLKILAKIKNVASDSDIKEAIAAVGLDPENKQLVKTFSLGMKQKLAIAQAIFEKPSLLLLDEPTNALDEESIYKVRNLLLEMKEKGATIIIASHNKEDLNILSDFRLKMIDGKLFAS